MLSDNREKILKTLDLPSVPMVALKILRLMDNPNAGVDDLQNAIMADQGLAARVIRMANSSFYSMSREIDTVSSAIFVMGFGTIKNLALAVATRDIYKKFGLLEQKLWEHSIGVSVAAGIIARQVRFFKPEEAVMAGLLHDIGKVVLNNNLPDQFLVLTQRVYEENVMYSAIEHDIFGFGHAEVGGLFAEKWRFPEALVSVIANHHDCEKFASTLPGDASEVKLCRIIALADAICLRLGIGYSGPMTDLKIDEDAMLARLEIPKEKYPELKEDIKQQYMKEKLSFH